mmetsp:Transcript_391/g.652  ORF Transcript_391/g.652 Transcript_391/m.652 type:complete len:550 (+) Transcript_391:188-1837(+)
MLPPAYPAVSQTNPQGRQNVQSTANNALSSSSYLPCSYYPTTGTTSVYNFPLSQQHQQYYYSYYQQSYNTNIPFTGSSPHQQMLMQQPQQPQSQLQPHGFIPAPPPPPPPPPRRHSSNVTVANSNQTNISTTSANKNTAVKETTATHSILPAETKDPTATQHQQQHHCDPCNTSFPTAHALSAHIKSHITCTKCPFTASKKIVSAHYKASHGQFAGRGLKTISIQVPGSRIVQRFKICVGNHPDDIKAWIEERKRRFPTRKNIENKLQKRKRSRQEGAIVVGQEGVEGGNSVGKKEEEEVNMDGSIEASGNGQAMNIGLHKEEKNEATKRCRGENMFNSIASLVEGYGSSSDECEDNDNHDISIESNDKTGKLQTEGAKIVHGTTTIMTDPTRQEEFESSNHNTLYNKTTKDSHSPPHDQADSTSKYKTKQCRYFLRNGTCKNGDSCTYIHDMEQHEAYKNNADSRKERQSQKDRARNQAKKEMNLLTSGRKDGGLGSGSSGGQTLLRKLLENDIRRERSLCLQLLRYIVDCNFLQEKRDLKEKDRDLL